jgi:hypothetical protein
MALVFVLAYVGYLLLGVTVACHFGKKPYRWLHVASAAVVLLHVFLVWDWRFHWSWDYAWEKSPAGFLLFHTALLLILTATILPLRWSRWCVLVAFPIVTTGALGATFRNEAVADYGWPLVAALLLTVALCWYGYRRTR